MLNFMQLKELIQKSDTNKLTLFRQELIRRRELQGSSFRLETTINTVDRELRNRKR